MNVKLIKGRTLYENLNNITASPNTTHVRLNYGERRQNAAQGNLSIWSKGAATEMQKE